MIFDDIVSLSFIDNRIYIIEYIIEYFSAYLKSIIRLFHQTYLFLLFGKIFISCLCS